MTSKRVNYIETECNSAKKKKEDQPDDHNKSVVFKIENKNKIFETCKQVSAMGFYNNAKRLKMLFLPNCSNVNNCVHTSRISNIQAIPPRVINSIQMELSGNMWYEVLEICFMCITPQQYLTSNVLGDIVEIILNAHQDITSEYTISHLIKKCEQTLALHFHMHPPCHNNKKLLGVYKDFLMGPTSSQSKQYSNRNNYDYKKGIIQYCLNRLESELSSESKDGPLINKDGIIPEEWKETTRGLHFEREEYEIYESLNRIDRIDRLMAVLRNIIELLQYDSFIIRSRESRVKPLILELLWRKEDENKEKNITKICKQIMELFVYIVHLDYPEEYMKTMGLWLNLVIETLYTMGSYSTYDYPNVGTFLSSFAKEFQGIVKELPHQSIIKILTRIEPSYMRHVIGFNQTKIWLRTNETNIISVLTTFLKEPRYNYFEKNCSDKMSLKSLNIPKVMPKCIMNHLSMICKNVTVTSNNSKSQTYQKLGSYSNNEINQNVIINVLCITLEAYLDAYNFKKYHELLKNMSESNYDPNKSSSIMCTEIFSKSYQNLYMQLNNFKLVLTDMIKEDKLPSELKVFESIIMNVYI